MTPDTRALWAAMDPDTLARELPQLPGWPWRDGPADLTPIHGGLNNGNWRLKPVGGPELFLKVPGVGTDSFVDRVVANEAASAAASVGVGPAVAFFDSVTGIEVTAFLDGYRPLTEYELSTTDVVFDVVRAYRRLHGAPLLSRSRTVVEEIAAALDDLAARGWRVPAWAVPVFVQWDRAADALTSSGFDRAVCHNDPNFTNMMTAPGKPLQLVDYEFAANNDPAYEVLGLISFYPVDEKTRVALIEEYYGAYTGRLDARMRLMHLALLMRFALWSIGSAFGRDPDYDYEKFGTSYFVYAEGLTRDPRWESWLAAV